MKRPPRLQPASPRTRAVQGLLAGLVVGVGLVLLRHTEAMESLEWRIADVRTTAFLGSRPPDPGIVMAVVESNDIEALKSVGQEWPWPLDLNALAFEWMAACGARAVVVDVYQVDKGMDAEERGLPPEAAEERAAAEAEAQMADILAAAYRRVGSVVLAFELLHAESARPAADRVRWPAFEARMAEVPPLEVPTRLSRESAYLPVLRLLRAAKALGYATATPDGDGVVRRAVPVARLRGRGVPSLPLAGAGVATGRLEVSGDRLRVGDALQRLSSDGSFYVAFRGRQGAYPRVHPADMVQAGDLLAAWRERGAEGEPPSVGTAVPSAVRGKIVLWGVNAAGLQDIVAAPVDARFPGPELQATIIDNLLHGDGRAEVVGWLNSAATVFVALLVGLLASVTRRLGYFLVAPGVILLLWGGSWAVYAAGWMSDLATPTLSVFVTVAAAASLKALTEGRRNRWLEGTFGKYLSPSVIEALKRDPSLIQLGGRRVEVSVLFSDVRGFTGISERLRPDDLVRLLNRYLTRQSAETLGEDGVIDKFFGDGVMAFFGDPIPHADHAKRACRAAVRSSRATADLESLTRELGVPEIVNRIGVNSGPALVGNMGSEARFDYTAMGDTVNLASRLESANKFFGSRILVGEATWDLAKDILVGKPIGRLVVMGRAEPVGVHEVVGLAGEAPEDLVRHARAFAEAHDAARSDDLETARARLAEAERLRPGDGPCAWLGRLLDDLEAGRRPRPWDGVVVLDAK